ncbi:FecR family protein [Pedobacter sp. BMA]|uniref:FecR family protein n=1 Tax=Pedobacter sp. BMA TaxID=1663685 RepID=UPI0006493EFA|nr:FecR family protein [Pedobacter sp. BMA]KLT67210.1 hypothetical protein AB669_00310 [Pedobacter sp. BMA]
MKPEERKILSRILMQYKAGELDEKRKTIIDRWFSEPEYQGAASSEQDEQLAAQLFAGILSKTTRKRKTSFSAIASWSVAASILLVAGTILFLRNHAHQKAAERVAYDTFTTLKGQVKEITLSDGTQVFMNAATSLRVRKNLNRSEKRIVMLDRGEAFFKVKRDARHPFSISSGQFITTVLGTSFNINFYPETGAYQVAVNTGKVKVEKTQGKELRTLHAGLTPGEVIRYDLRSGETALTRDSQKQLCSWKNDRSVYIDQMDLAQIAQVLSRQYNIPVKISGPKTRKYSFKLGYLPLADALLEIARNTGVSYEQTNQMITLNPAR